MARRYPERTKNKILELIEMKENRPMRTMVGHSMGIDRINKESDSVQDELIQMLKPIYSTQ